MKHIFNTFQYSWKCLWLWFICVSVDSGCNFHKYTWITPKSKIFYNLIYYIMFLLNMQSVTCCLFAEISVYIMVCELYVLGVYFTLHCLVTLLQTFRNLYVLLRFTIKCLLWKLSAYNESITYSGTQKNSVTLHYIYAIISFSAIERWNTI